LHSWTLKVGIVNQGRKWQEASVGGVDPMRIIVKYRGYAFRALQFDLIDIRGDNAEMNFSTLIVTWQHAQSCGTVITVIARDTCHNVSELLRQQLDLYQYRDPSESSKQRRSREV
jgi:hypothetical protein